VDENKAIPNAFERFAPIVKKAETTVDGQKGGGGRTSGIEIQLFSEIINSSIKHTAVTRSRVYD
jgi:hypothetical protein